MAKDTSRVLTEKDLQLFDFIYNKTANRTIIYSSLTRLEKRKKTVPWVQRMSGNRNIHNTASGIISN